MLANKGLKMEQEITMRARGVRALRIIHIERRGTPKWAWRKLKREKVMWRVKALSLQRKIRGHIK